MKRARILSYSSRCSLHSTGGGRTRDAHFEHEKAKSELKSLMPEDAQQAIGHGIKARRSKSGAISFDLVQVEGQTHAAV